MNDADTLEAWLEIVKVLLNCIPTLVWQIIVVGIVLCFREQIAELFDRIASLKVGQAELTLQPVSPEATSPGGEADAEIAILGSEGFFTKEGIVQLIENSGLIVHDEHVVGQLLLFYTKKQRTWLVATNRYLFCILDDDKTKATGKLIQWRISLDKAHPIEVRAHKAKVGLVSIGERRNWLYSRRLHPTTDGLKQEIKRLLKRAKRATI